MLQYWTNAKYDPIESHFKLAPYTVCPGSSDPPEKTLNISASENEVTPFFNYCDILGWILFAYRAKQF